MRLQSYSSEIEYPAIHKKNCLPKAVRKKKTCYQKFVSEPACMSGYSTLLHLFTNLEKIYIYIYKRLKQ